MNRRRFASALVLGTASACFSRGGGGGPQQPPTTLVVRNQSFLEMVIYLLPSSGASNRVRLGNAASNRDTTFTIPRQYVFGLSTLRFLADPIGSNRTPLSDQIQVSPGDRVVIIIPP
jgi:hypothetical protein